MNAKKILGILLVTLGILALVYGGFTYTEDSHEVDLGPVAFELEEKESVPVPPWVGIVAIVGGLVLIALPKK